MHKVTKILVKIVSTIILLSIILPVAVSLSLSIPSVQNRAVRMFADFATNKLGTRVEVEHITLGMLNRVKIRGFYVEDFDADTLLYAGSVTAYLGSFSNLKDGLTINVARAEDTKFFLRQSSRGVMNVKEVVDKLSKRKGEGRFKLKIRSLDARNLEFRLQRPSTKVVEPDAVDYADMQLTGINAHIDDFYVIKGAVGGDVRSLSFDEKSGFHLDNLAGRLLVDKGVITLDDMTLHAEGVDLRSPYVRLLGDGWSSYKDFIHNVRLEVQMENSSASSGTVGYFAPALRRWQTTISEATVSMHGTVADFEGRIDNLRLEDGGTLRATALVKGLIDVPKTKFDVDVERLDATSDEVVRLLHNIARLNIGDKVGELVHRTKRVDASGHFEGTLSDFDASLQLAVATGGSVDVECKMGKSTDSRTLIADIAADSLDLGAILDLKSLGDASFKLYANGALAGKNSQIAFNGDIQQLAFNDYNYHNGSFNGSYGAGDVEVDFDVNDEHLKAELDASVMLATEEREPLYNLLADIREADLAALRLNRRDTVALFGATVAAGLAGRNIEEMQGEISIANARYQHNEEVVESDLAKLTIAKNLDEKIMEFTSPFADAMFTTQATYADAWNYLRTLLVRYVPKLYADGGAKALSHLPQESNDARNVYFSLTTRDATPLAACFTDEVDIAPDSRIDLVMDVSHNLFELKGASDYVSLRRYLVTEMKLAADNRQDSLAVSLSSADLYAGSLHITQFDTKIGARDNESRIAASFADSVGDLRGELNVKAHFARRDSMRRISLDVLPSRVKRKDQIWNITSDGIDIDSSQFDIRHFRIYNADDKQNLLINGVASRSLKDSLTIRLENFSLSPFAQFATNMGYNVQGRTSGDVKIRSVLHDTELNAQVELDSLRVNDMDVPDLQLLSRWDFGRSRAALSVRREDNGAEIAKGFFSPRDMRYYVSLQTKSLSLGLLDPILKGVISETKGETTVDLVLQGQRNQASLDGKLIVSNMQTQLDFTKCVYTAPKAEILVRNNRFYMRDVPIFDEAKNRGQIDMNLKLDHLSNIEYDMLATFRQFKVLNTDKRDNDMFYGNVFASGEVAVRGDKAGVAMEINATTNDGSHFFMPLSGKSNISTADFVTFTKASQVDTTNYLVRKKMLFERRNRQRSAGGGAMDIAMTLNVRPNAEVQLVIDPTVGDIIKGRGEGLLNIRVAPKASIFEMYGDYTISEGSYLFTLQNIINKKFIIEPGSTIQWTGEPLDALLNIDAIYQVKASLQPLLEGYISRDGSIPTRAVPVDCVIRLTDRLTKPTVNFDVLVPSVDANIQSIIANVLSTPERRSQQFLYLLLSNSFMSDSSSEASSFGVSSAAVTGFEMLSNQLSNWLANDSSNIVFRYRPRTETMMSDEVDFGFSQGLLNNRLLIEVEGNYLVDKSRVVNATSSFTGEAYVTWLIDKAGTLRLKGFTHTIDRFDENQGLQETGLGIYYKEEFDNARDLRDRVANRFSRRRRNESSEKRNSRVDTSGADEGAKEMLKDGEQPVNEDITDNYD